VNKNKVKKGTLITCGVELTAHEIDAVKYLLSLGHHIQLIPTKDTPTPDFLMDNKPWELKCPRTKNVASLTRTLREATKQSPNVIFDLRRLPGHTKSTAMSLARAFRQYSPARRLLILTKNQLPLAFSKK